MKIIFCEDPLNKTTPDEMYQAEASAAQAVGFDYELINFEALVYEKNIQKSIRLVSPGNEETIGLYRGWMLKPADYQLLYEGLLSKGIKLVNNPIAYQHCHYLPDSYEVIKQKTPKTVWLPVEDAVDMDEVMALLAPFGKSAIILKDYVKSQKHYWAEACFIPDASNRDAVSSIVARFMDLQGDDLNEGLVFREYVELESLTTHSKSGMPLTKEFRVFVFNGTPLLVSEYWEEGDYKGIVPSLAQFTNEFTAVQSNFYTMDIAKQIDGEWIIMELGDGQVAGLPERVDPVQFYGKLAEIVI